MVQMYLGSRTINIFVTVAFFCVVCACKTMETVIGAQMLATAGSEIPLRDFFKNSEQASFKISPDGLMVAFVKPWKNRMNIFVQTLSEDHLPFGQAKQLTFNEERDVASFFWKKNTILYLKDMKGDENFHLYSIDVSKGKEKSLTDFKGVKVSVVDDLDGVSGDSVLIQMNKRKAEVFDVYRLNALTGQMKIVAKNNGRIVSWITDHKGKIRIAIESDGVRTKILLRNMENKKFNKIIEFGAKDDFSPQFFDFENKNFYAVSNLGRDKAAVVLIDSSTGKELEVLFEHPEYDADGLFFSKKRKVVTAASFISWKQEFKFFDKLSEQRNIWLKSQIANDEEILLTSTNDAENIYTVVVLSDKNRGRYFVFDQDKEKLHFLADPAPWLDSKKMASMKPIQYRARDGLMIHGYLTLPNMEQDKNLPLIVNPHGGPWVRDEWGFNSEVQFLASRGYAVFQMNYRGSTGYGKNFLAASFKQWGKAMQDDITDGVQWLIKEGVADPSRIAIYGASYGGYATLAGLAFTPDLYACGVDYVGVSNLFTLMKSIPPYWKPFLEKMYEMVGDPEKDAELMREVSPVFHADKIKVPVFVAQGAKDPRVNINESNQIVEALQKRGVIVEYMVKEDEGHGFHNEENRFDFYEKMSAFLKKHL